jgi:hypothetical protein
MARPLMAKLPRQGVTMIEDPPAITDDDHDESFKRDEEERCQQERIDKAPIAVVEEREEWEERLAEQKQEHWAQIILFCIIVAALVWVFLSH